MKAPNIVLVTAATFAISSAGAWAQVSDQGATLFAEKCSACHTVGKGKLAGPDLANVTSWPEADLRSAVKRMEKMVGPLTDAQVKDIVTFLHKPEAAKQLDDKQKEMQDKAAIERDKNPASAAKGRELFLGSQPLTNGGMSCISCHSAGQDGGNLGVDLSTVSQRLSETALVSACENASFKIMKAAYANHPITHDEARDLTAYLQTTKPSPANTGIGPVWLGAIGITLAVVAIIGIGFRNRNTDVRKKLRRR